MLTGISRSGKSTLINILSEKLISLETPEFLSVTTEINEYIIYKEIKKDTIIKLKFIDTPGLIQEKDNDTTDKVIKSINIKLKEFEDTNDIIHIIYFFMPDNPNLEQSKKFFTYLNDLNTERIKKGLPKLPVLFIFNRNPSDYNHDSLKQFLRENNYNNLYEEKKQIIKGKKDKMRRKKFKNDDDFEDNIILVNLLKGYNRKGEEISKVYGIPELLKATIYLIKKANPFKDEDFNKLKNYAQQFKEFNSKIDKGEKLSKEQEKEFKILKEDCKNLMIHISEGNSLLYKLRDQNKIIEKAKNQAYKIIYKISALGFMAAVIPVPFVDLPILYSLNMTMIIKIGHCFNVSFSEISNKTLALLTFGLEANVESSAKIVGNGIGAVAGEKYGKDLVKDIGSQQVKEWSDCLYLASETVGSDFVDVAEVGESLLVNNESKYQGFINYFYNLFPSFQEGVQKGIDYKGQKLGNKVAKILVDNTEDLAEDVAKQSAQYWGNVYGGAITSNAKGYFQGFMPKLVPILGSLIGGISDSYSTYKAGTNAIKYFEEYIKKTNGCEFVIKRKEEYEKILNCMEIMSNNNFDNFKVNILN